MVIFLVPFAAVPIAVYIFFDARTAVMALFTSVLISAFGGNVPIPVYSHRIDGRYGGYIYRATLVQPSAIIIGGYECLLLRIVWYTSSPYFLIMVVLKVSL